MTEICYNEFNLPVFVTDANGIVTKYSYSDAGLVTRIERLENGGAFAYVDIAYDRYGRPESYTDQDGLTKSFERDAFGKVLKERFPDGSECAYSYDSLGRLAAVLDENSHRIEFDWTRFGLKSRTTAAGQLTDYVRDDKGLVTELVSTWNGKVDRRIENEYDDYGRLVRADYGNGETETFAYDKWNRISKHTRGKTEETYKYDHFGRLVEKREDGVATAYKYDNYGNRLYRATKDASGKTVSWETRQYDKVGRLVAQQGGPQPVSTADAQKVTYAYDSRGRLAKQTIGGNVVEFSYNSRGQLVEKAMRSKLGETVALLKYGYAKSGKLESREVNGEYQHFVNDAKGQLVQVNDINGNPLEEYAYDPAGNMLKKTIRGKTTTFAYDSANQLVSSTCDGVTTRYAYDAAGRMVREGAKRYAYGYLDKVMSVHADVGDSNSQLTTHNSQLHYTYTYHADGQLATANYGGNATETFLWDGLALIQRGDEQFVNEPHIGGGNPVASSKGASYFNDALGTTLGSKSDGKYSAAALSAFGENLSVHSPTPTHNSNFFTGKPEVPGLGHAFLMRNYRAGLAKWQTADPMGYPDGWNQLAYCGNGVAQYVDFIGAERETTVSFGWIWEWDGAVEICEKTPLNAGLEVPGVSAAVFANLATIVAQYIQGGVANLLPLWDVFVEVSNEQGGGLLKKISTEASSVAADRARQMFGSSLLYVKSVSEELLRIKDVVVDDSNADNGLLVYQHVEALYLVHMTVVLE